MVKRIVATGAKFSLEVVQTFPTFFSMSNDRSDRKKDASTSMNPISVFFEDYWFIHAHDCTPHSNHRPRKGEE